MRGALSLLMLAMLACPALAADSVPTESVKALAALDNNGGWRPIFDNTRLWCMDTLTPSREVIVLEAR
jgi:hypothetical protein